MIIGIVSLFSCLIISSILGAGSYAITSGSWMPSSAPDIVRYSTRNNTRMIGTPTIVKYEGISEDECVDRCTKNIGCLSVTYQDKIRGTGNCNLYKLNSAIDPRGLSTNWPGYVLHEKRYIWNRYNDPKQGYMEDVGGMAKKDKQPNAMKCAYKCLMQHKDPECTGFNYNDDTQYCELLSIPIKGNEYAFNARKAGEVYELKPYTIDQRNVVPDVDELDTKSDTKPDAEPGAGPEETFHNIVNMNRYRKPIIYFILLIIGLAIFQKNK